MQVANLIEELNHKFSKSRRYNHPTPQHINYGNCWRFARLLSRKLGGAKVECDGVDYKERHQLPTGYYHCYILTGGKYYDSEAPHGVENPLDLPTYVRWKVSPNDICFRQGKLNLEMSHAYC